MEPVFLTSCPSYEFPVLQAAVERAADALGLERYIRPGMQVLLKPNLLMKARPDRAVVTHPLVTAAIGVYLQRLGASIMIADSPGGIYSPAVLKGIYAACGYEDVAREHGFTLNTDCSYRPLETPNGRRSKVFQVISPALDADLIVDIAKLKSHCMTGLSGAVKNLFGVVPGLMKPELHCRFPDKEHFGEMLADLCEAIAPRIAFVDAVTAMEGNGPSGGKPRQVGLLAASTSPFPLDVACAAIAGMDPMEIPMLRSGQERGLCPARAEELEILGEPLDAFLVPDFLQPESQPSDFLQKVPRIFRPLAVKICTPFPKIRAKDCIGCAKCQESCPQHTIEIRDRKAFILSHDCIRCYCCHEMCPVQAIDIKRFSLFNL